MIIHVRCSVEVAASDPRAVRRRTVGGELLEFNRQGLYFECEEVPKEILADEHLTVKEVPEDGKEEGGETQESASGGADEQAHQAAADSEEASPKAPAEKPTRTKRGRKKV